MGLSDADFKRLLNMRKVFAKNGIVLPNLGGRSSYDLNSVSTNDKFILDTSRQNVIELSKFKIQKRYALTKFPLVRIDINSPCHKNPDGRILSRNHIHIYSESDYDTGNLMWAYELTEIAELGITDKTSLDFMTVFYCFCDYCNIDSGNVQEVI